jgi:methionyl-tRNA formyltransferase
MKVIFLAQREWALEVKDPIERHPNVSKLELCKELKELESLNLKDYDLLITCGWSTELNEICDKVYAIGVHCAELDRFSYGAPLQLQIIDGLKETKHRVFKFVNGGKTPIRAHTHTREYSHECSLDLRGSMADILKQMTTTSIFLFNSFLDDFPNIEWKTWPAETTKRPPRAPRDSKIQDILTQNTNTESLYNFIRCLEYPYPNAFIEDEVGILYFEKVKFKKK